MLSVLLRADALWLTLLCALVYANSVHNPFVFDDQILILDNLSLRQLWPPSGWTLGPELPLSSRPLIRLSLALNYALGGPDPAGFRLANIGVHLLASFTGIGVVGVQPQRVLKMGHRSGDRIGDESFLPVDALLFRGGHHAT